MARVQGGGGRGWGCQSLIARRRTRQYMSTCKARPRLHIACCLLLRLCTQGQAVPRGVCQSILGCVPLLLLCIFHSLSVCTSGAVTLIHVLYWVFVIVRLGHVPYVTMGLLFTLSLSGPSQLGSSRSSHNERQPGTALHLLPTTHTVFIHCRHGTLGDSRAPPPC